MEITLEKIELVKDRTGVTYKEAKEALEQADGSIVDAIIIIEENIDSQSKRSFALKSGTIVETLKEFVKKGNISKIVVKNSDGGVVLNVPVNAGIIGAVIAPWGVIASAVAALGLKCVVEIVKTDGTIIDVSDKASVTFDKATEKGSEVYEKIKNSETKDKIFKKADKTKDELRERFENFKNKTEEVKEQEAEKDKSEDVFEF